MPGHVFIVRADLTKLACDAWLLPCDETLIVSPGWHETLPPSLRDRLGSDSRLDIRVPAGWGNDGIRARRLTEWNSADDEPQPWLVNTGGNPETEDGWYLEGLHQFVEAAAADRSESRYGRARPLVGLPLIATGLGGRAEDAGAIVKMLLPELTHLLAPHPEPSRHFERVVRAPHQRISMTAWAVCPSGRLSSRHWEPPVIRSTFGLACSSRIDCRC
jgi:hypothetical protein